MNSRDLLLQPVSSGDLIDRSLRLYRRHFSSLLAIAAIPGFVAVLGGLVVVFAGADLWLTMSGYLTSYGLAPVLNLMVVGGLCQVIADHVMRNQPISFLRTWRVILQHWDRLMATAFIGWMLLPISLMIIGGAMAILLGISSLLLIPTMSGRTGSWLIALPVIALMASVLVIGGLLFLEVYARVVMMPAAAILERQPMGSAISRGMQLGARTSPKVLAVLAFQYCLTWSIATALGVPLGLYAAAEGLSLGDNAPQAVAMGFNILAQFGTLLSAPVAVVAFALLYFDNRVRKEGLDVEILAQDMRFPSEQSASGNLALTELAP